MRIDCLPLWKITLNLIELNNVYVWRQCWLLKRYHTDGIIVLFQMIRNWWFPFLVCITLLLGLELWNEQWLCAKLWSYGQHAFGTHCKIHSATYDNLSSSLTMFTSVQFDPKDDRELCIFDCRHIAFFNHLILAEILLMSLILLVLLVFISCPKYRRDSILNGLPY